MLRLAIRGTRALSTLPAAPTSSTATTRRVKRSTGLVGLPVDPDARTKLISLYKQTLVETENLKHPIKKDTVAITSYRLKVVETNEDAEKIEEEICCGQIEELVVQAKKELELVRWLIQRAEDREKKAALAKKPS